MDLANEIVCKIISFSSFRIDLTLLGVNLRVTPCGDAFLLQSFLACKSGPRLNL